jgi:hypothetical protein
MKEITCDNNDRRLETLELCERLKEIVEYDEILCVPRLVVVANTNVNVRDVNDVFHYCPLYMNVILICVGFYIIQFFMRGILQTFLRAVRDV